MQNALEKLEFAAIRDRLLVFARTERAKEAISDLGVFLDERELIKEQDDLREMIRLRERFGSLPIGASPNLAKSVAFAKKGGVLSEANLEGVASDILTNAAIHRYFSQAEPESILRIFAFESADLSSLEKAIHAVITPDLTIYDNASPALKGIRQAIRNLEREITRKVSTLVSANREYLTSETLSMRNGHYVIPVSSSYKNKVKGIIQDISHSGGTTFIEPEALVVLNNRMRELEVEEREEIHRLLAELSAQVASHGEEVIRINEMIGRLDFLDAKAKYAAEIHGVVADYSETPKIHLRAARHPLIDPAKIVPNDFDMSKETPIFVISGPNAGGKTIAIKTVGLLVAMNECGLPIPADLGSSLSYFNAIYVDIGDSQSITDSLSTFSGHMANRAALLKAVGNRDLVLLDEIGTGTSPWEGESIAYAVLMRLKEKQAFALVSSHFEGLKAAALSESGITNASMRFNDDTLEPTYRLLQGVPGDSYGLVVARRFGMDEKTMAIAEKRAHENHEISVSEALRKLNATSASLEKEREQIAILKAHLQGELEEAKRKEEIADKRLANLKNEVNALKEKELAEYKKKADEILENLKGEGVKKGDVTRAKNALEDLREVEKEIDFDEEIKVGDYVAIPSLSVTGRVTAIRGNTVTLVSDGGTTWNAKKNRLCHAEEPAKKSAPMSGIKLDEVGATRSVPLELNIIGYRAEPALSALDKYLDDCRLKGYKRVRIIHGFGTGILRKMVRESCDKHPQFIASYEAAGESEGAGGATIVFLK